MQGKIEKVGSMTHVLDVRNLVMKFYTEEGIVHAVNGVSYTLDAGESLGIVGESGSGKTVVWFPMLKKVSSSSSTSIKASCLPITRRCNG
jgi:oligopeptide transport system ATP-binding protein